MLKKLIFILSIIIVLPIFAQDSLIEDETVTNKTENRIEKIEEDIKIIKNDITKLKESTQWLNFSLSGYARIAWGITFDGPMYYMFYNSSALRVAHGFDFDSNFDINFDINKTVFQTNNSEKNAEISFKFKTKTVKPAPYSYEPDGSWYMMDAVDDDGNEVKVYFPKYEDNDQPLRVGNIEFALEEAMIKNILGFGVFGNYSDVTQTQQYYGIEPMTEVLTLNHKYFNNGFINTNGNRTGNLYYSFDNSDYEPNAKVSESVKFWTSDMLSEYQKPHGFSAGIDNDITRNFNLYVEAGIASKDAFDPKYDQDKELDYSFFINAEPLFHSGGFEFHPKLAFTAAFQTQTTGDYNTSWSTMNFALSIPIVIPFSKNSSNFLRLEINNNLKHHIATQDTAYFFSFNPELSVLDGMLNFKMPIQYSYKNKTGGFLLVENANIYSIDQIREEHIFNMGINIDFSTKHLLSETFEIKFANDLYITSVNDLYTETFFYEILKTDFIFKNVPFLGLSYYINKIALFVDFGFAVAHNARVESIFENDGELYRVTDNTDRVEWTKVLDLKTGLEMEVIKNVLVGFSFYTPKILLDSINPVGNQHSNGTIEIWSEIRL